MAGEGAARGGMKDLHDHKDWTKLILINPWRNQESCNCCWAIASCSCIDCMYIINREPTETAPQQLVDCIVPNAAQRLNLDKRDCFKLSLNTGYRYVVKNRVHHERDYRFRAWRGPCKRVTSNHRLCAIFRK